MTFTISKYTFNLGHNSKIRHFSVLTFVDLLKFLLRLFKPDTRGRMRGKIPTTLKDSWGNFPQGNLAFRCAIHTR